MLDDKQAQQRFNASADTYEEHAFLAQAVAHELVERLQYLDISATTIVDVGCGTGLVTDALAQSQFKNADVIQIDYALQRLQWQQQHKDFALTNNCLCADALKLPLKTHSVDVLLSSLCLPFVINIAALFREWQRVLKPGGVCAFATLGPDTLIELREAFAQVHEQAHVHGFYDMHDVGDALVKAQFAEPVMDIDRMTVAYDQVADLLQDLKQQGVTNVLEARQKGLLTPSQLQKMQTSYAQKDGRFAATFEVVFATAWASDSTLNRKVGNEVRVPLHSLKRR